MTQYLGKLRKTAHSFQNEYLFTANTIMMKWQVTSLSSLKAELSKASFQFLTLIVILSHVHAFVKHEHKQPCRAACRPQGSAVLAVENIFLTISLQFSA